MEDRIPSTEIYGENWENWTWSAMLDLLKDLRVAINQSEKYGGATSSTAALLKALGPEDAKSLLRIEEKIIHIFSSDLN